jgi:hypothetical protein
LPDINLNAPNIPHISLANGAIIRERTFAEIGEAGTEAVIPITRPRRADQLMDESGLTARVLARFADSGGGGPLVSFPNATIQDATDVELVAQRVNVARRLKVA